MIKMIRRVVLIVIVAIVVRIMMLIIGRSKAPELIQLIVSTAVLSTTPNTQTRIDNIAGNLKNAASKLAVVTSQNGASVGSANNLGTTQTGTPQSSSQNSFLTSFANAVSSGQTSSSLSGSNAHTHDYGGHQHGYGHVHFSQVQGDFNNNATVLNNVISALNAAQIL